MLLDYESSTYEMDDVYGSKNSIYLYIPVLNTDFTCQLFLFLDDWDADAEEEYRQNLDFLTQRQKQLKANASDIAPKNKIKYTPPIDSKPAEDNPKTLSENLNAVEEVTQQIAAKEISIYANTALGEYLAMNMMQGVARINVSVFKEASDTDYLINALCEAYRQNPLIGAVTGFGFDYSTGEVTIEYDLSPDEMKAMQSAVIAEIGKVVTKIIKPGMSDFEKEMAINQYLCETAEYDYAALENAEKNDFLFVDKEFIHSFTPYGVLINKVGVCASYAGAFKLLGEAAGLDIIVVTGYLYGSLPHAWNRVNIDNNWMTIDSTNNDSLIENALFNIPDHVAIGILVEDNTYIFKSVLAKLKGVSEVLEWYRATENFYALSDLKLAFVEGLRKGENFLLRTDYDVSQEVVIEILSDALRGSGIGSISGLYYWIGVVYVVID
jgi:hypothetical protein